MKPGFSSHGGLSRCGQGTVHTSFTRLCVSQYTHLSLKFIADRDNSQIRNKRLAKLGSQASGTAQSSSRPQSSENDSETPPQAPAPSSPTGREPASQGPQINISSGQAPSSSPLLTPSQSDMQQSNEGAPRIRIGPSLSQSKAESPSVSGTSTPRAHPRSSETIEDFGDKTLRAVFRVTLDEGRRIDVHGQKLIYLAGLRQELQEQGQAPRMSVDVLDQALLEAASNTDNGNPMEYLLPCWKRVTRLYKGFRKHNADDRKYVIVSEARRLCMSYCIFAATMPEMFGYVPFAIISMSSQMSNLILGLMLLPLLR